MANRILGIEYADDRIKIVEVGLGRRLKIFNFAVIDNRSVEPHRRAEQLSHTLQVRGFEAKEAVIATSGGNVEHRLLTLPPLSAREMHFVMQRESKKLAPTGITDMVWSYDVLKTKEELGIKKNQILLVTAERQMVDAAQQFFSQTRLKVLQVTTAPEAVLNLLRQATPWKKEAVRTIVHFSGDLVQILFVQDGVLLLSREVRFDYGDTQQSDQVERITSELRRSTLYFRQNFPQAQLDQILFSGDNDVIGALSARSVQELNLQGSLIQFEENLDTSGFRGNWDEFRFNLPALTAAIGAAWRKTPGSTGVNLVPGKTQAREQAGLNPAKIALAACAVAVAVMLLIVGYYFFAKGGIDAERQALTQRAAVVDPKLQQAAETMVLRDNAEQRSAFLHRVGARTDWTEMFRRLTFIVPETAVFDAIQVQGANPPKMIIRGHLSASTAAQSNADFNRFFSNLRALPFFTSVTMPKPTVVSYEDSATTTQVSNQVRSKVSFEVECHLP
ncbi:MAG TPA: pilus assembly protein PilM [Terriglobia bacterium]|nr:pilus assembly protein PilM [Terriglobia bacterium]